MKNIFKGTTMFRALGLKKSVLALALGATFSMGYVSTSVAASPNVPPSSLLKKNAAPIYVVRKGDTLWDISGRFLKQPWRWREIWAGNRYIKNPNLIYPGDRLLLCSYNNKPLIGKDEGDGCEGIIKRRTVPGASAPVAQVRVESLNNSIPAIPLSDIEKWLDHADIVAADSITHTPYIIGIADGRIIAGAHQNVYARGNGIQIGEKYSVYRVSQPYMLTNLQGEQYNAGVEITEVASGVATKQDNDIATIEISKSFNNEILQGDLVLPAYESDLPSLFFPVEEHTVVPGGQVLRVQGSIGDAAKRSVVTINRGTLEGAKVGHVFNVAQHGVAAKDPRTGEMVTLPNEKVGSIMVFKTFDHLSYGYVLESELPIKVGAVLTAPRVSD